MAKIVASYDNSGRLASGQQGFNTLDLYFNLSILTSPGTFCPQLD